MQKNGIYADLWLRQQEKAIHGVEEAPVRHQQQKKQPKQNNESSE